MIEKATKYCAVEKKAADSRQPLQGKKRTAQVLVPTLSGARECLAAWWHRELKEGGFLDSYLKREKGQMPAMIRKVARIMAGFQPNNKSDIRRVAAIPARLFHRWKAEDKDFFSDDANLRSLKRDNPELPVYVDGRVLPRGRFHKAYLTAKTLTAKNAESAKNRTQEQPA